MDKWRTTLIQLVILEFVVCVVFFAIGYVGGDSYFRGVGVGLLISWVTGALAYFIMKSRVGAIRNDRIRP